MSIIDDPVDDDTAGQSSAAPPDKPPIKLRSKKHGRAENGRLRPTSIHIFEDLEKNGVIPDKALSSYKVHRAQLMFLHLARSFIILFVKWKSHNPTLPLSPVL